MKKKVFLFIPTVGSGGAEKMVIDLAAGIDRTKYDVTLFSLYDKSKANPERVRFAESKGVNIRYLNKKSGFDIKLLIRMAKLIRKEKPDVLHSHIESFQYVSVIGCLFNIKHIHTMHSIGGKEHRLYACLLKNAYKNKQFYMIALSKSIYEQLSQMYSELGDRLKIIYNGVDIDRFKSEKENMNTNIVEYICVANLTEVKNHRMMLQSFRKLTDLHDNSHLTLVGDGILRNDLEKQALQLGIQDKVTFTGSVSDPTLYLKKADIFVMSSHYEGMPLSVAEAMAAGLPIIAPHVGGIPEMVTENGILYTVDSEEELTKAMTRLSQDRILWKAYHNKSKERSKLFDIKEMVSKYEALYEI